MLVHLRSEIEAGHKTVTALTLNHSDGDAKIAAGGITALETLWDLLHPPKKPVEVPEPPFVDPALR